MKTQEDVLKPKETYGKEQPKTSEISDAPTITQKSHYSTMVQRQNFTDTRNTEKDAKSKTEDVKEATVPEKVVPRSLRPL